MLDDPDVLELDEPLLEPLNDEEELPDELEEPVDDPVDELVLVTELEVLDDPDDDPDDDPLGFGVEDPDALALSDAVWDEELLVLEDPEALELNASVGLALLNSLGTDDGIGTK